MREIVLDTETTGLDPFQGHRLVEIGCVELLNRIPTGVTFHRYLNPEREVPAEAFNVHGLSTEFLSDKPLFGDVCDELLEFLADATLIAHNASFDYGFLCAELERCKRATLMRDRVIDTIALARRTRPAHIASMLCVHVTASTIRGAPSMARSSMPNFSPRSISSSSVPARRHSSWSIPSAA